MWERDILDKLILWRFLHIPKNSVIELSRPTVASISFNEEKLIIGFPSGRRAWYNRCTGLTFPSSIANPSSITGVAGNASKKFPTPVEHSKEIRNFF